MNQKFIEWFTKNNNGCSPAMEDDRSFVCEKTQHMFEAYQAGVAEGESRCAALAAENAGLIKFCKDAAFDADYEAELGMERGGFTDALNDIKTPATDTFLAEVRASAIPEGYTLVPQQIFLDPSDIESICSQCGDGHESGYGDFTDGLLWIGNIQRDDGSIVHGLHISSADYSEEGGVTVCEFADQLRKGVQS
ncbi:hypothetical protein [Enterobacter ludwigii]|uniref:hypothetical protein n=1 Tax=Enterobacter ludwigii TaxID=299767 RepID=UPI0020B16FD0|nr:hypothetical protein [Enterobacter ludwigii]